MIINLNGISINYKKEGFGDPLILVHGWGGSINSLYKLFELASQSYDTTILDLPGFGRSDPPGTNWGTKEYAELIVKLLDQLSIEKANFFGHSFGGSLGIYLAANFPEGIKKLILCAPSYKRSRREAKANKILKSIIKNGGRYQKLSKPFRKAYYRFFHPQSDLIKYPGLENNFKKIISFDLIPLLARIEAPTLILWGQEDQQTLVDNAHLLHEKIPQSTLRIFNDAGHNLPLVEPKRVYEEISIWLKEHRANDQNT